MKVNLIKNINQSFAGTEVQSPATAPKAEKKKFLDGFETKIKNAADLNDTIQVPRTIFKGYLAFMVSTAIASLAAFIKNSPVKKVMNVASILIATYGTYSFVRPYIIKGADKK